MLIKVFCVVSMLSKLGGGGGGAIGLLNKGGGSNRLPGLVTKQQAVEFPQVLTSKNYWDKRKYFNNENEPNTFICAHVYACLLHVECRLRKHVQEWSYGCMI